MPGTNPSTTKYLACGNGKDLCIQKMPDLGYKACSTLHWNPKSKALRHSNSLKQEISLTKCSYTQGSLKKNFPQFIACWMSPSQDTGQEICEQKNEGINLPGLHLSSFQELLWQQAFPLFQIQGVSMVFGPRLGLWYPTIDLPSWKLPCNKSISVSIGQISVDWRHSHKNQGRLKQPISEWH